MSDERRSTRGRSALAVLLLAIAVGACALPVWVTATGVSALAGHVPVRVHGSAVAPLVPATALVLAAAGAAIALAGRLGRWVVAAVVLAGGVAVVVAAAVVIADPSAAATDAVGAQTGIDHLAGPASVTAAPWVTVLVGVVGLLVGLLVVRSSASWATSRRHEVAPASAGAPDERSDWDDLTRGTDPSEGS